MDLIKIAAEDLLPGMFVAELDRPWLDTPFVLQGFVIRDADDAREVARHVRYVYVDASYRGGGQFLAVDPSASTKSSKTVLVMKEDFLAAKVSFDSAAGSLEKVFEALGDGDAMDLSMVEQEVSPLIEGVFQNQEAVAALLRLRKSGSYRYNHGIAMSLWGVILGKRMGLDRERLEKLAVGCAICDLGMTKMPPEMLQQRHAFDAEQLAQLRQHPAVGAEMVAALGDIDREILAMVEYHHERIDGSGYPHGLEGDTIPLLAQIAGLVDTYDAMVSPRIYAKTRTSHEAALELIDRKGHEFDDELIEHFVQAIGLFPTGVLIELNTGEVGIVIRQNDTRRLKPEVMLVLDAEKVPQEKNEIVDLSNQNAGAEPERWITRELLAGSHDLNVQDYFE